MFTRTLNCHRDAAGSFAGQHCVRLVALVPFVASLVGLVVASKLPTPLAVLDVALGTFAPLSLAGVVLQLLQGKATPFKVEVWTGIALLVAGQSAPMRTPTDSRSVSADLRLPRLHDRPVTLWRGAPKALAVDGSSAGRLSDPRWRYLGMHSQLLINIVT
jgi:hypothetical protein